MGTLSYYDPATGSWVVSQDAEQPAGVQLTDNVIHTNHIADLNVTDAKILSVDASKITGTLNASIIPAGSITNNQIANGAIGSSQLDATVLDTIDSKNGVHYSDSQPSSAVSGDIWFDTGDGNKLYVYNGSSWVTMQDSATAQQTATNALTTAGGKNKIYYQNNQPIGTNYVVGDTWFDTDDNNHVYIWNGTTWSNAQDGTIAIAQQTANTAQDAASGKNTNYYQTSQPTGGTYIKGDTWFDTDDGNKIYVFDGSVWKDSTDSRTILGASKSAVYYQNTQPTGGVYLKGDMWFDTANNYKQYIYTGSGWQLVADVYNAQATANTALTSANGKNKTIYSTTTPSGTGFVVGDTWYTYSGSGITTLYRYDGSTWVQQTLVDGVFGSIDAAKITSGYINSARLNAGSITGDKLAANTITAGQMAVGTITAASGIIADAAITTAKIADASITNAKIGSLDASKITTGTLNANLIGARSITGAKIAANTITASNMVTGTITAASGIIANATIGTAQIIDQAVTNAKIGNLAVGTAQIADAAIVDAKVSNLSAGKITTGTLDAARIGANTITASKIFVGDNTNLIADGGFVDTAMKNWVVSGGATASIATYPNADNECILTNLNTTVSTVANTNVFQVTPGDQLHAECYVKGGSTNTGSGTVTLGISYTLFGGVTQTAVIQSASLSSIVNVYNMISGDIVVPDTAVSAYFYLSITDSIATDKVYLKRASAKRKINGGLIVDGSITANQILSGTITAESGIIKSIDGSVIRAGTISAEMIQTVPVSKLTGTLPANQIDPTLGSQIDISNNANVVSKADSSTVSDLSTRITNLNGSIESLINVVKIGSDGIDIVQNSANSSSTDKQMAVHIDGDSMDFLENGIPVAKITGQRMTIRNATIAENGEIVVGAHSITKSGTNTIFRWVG